MANEYFELGVRDMMNGILYHADIADDIIYITNLLFENNANALIIRERGVPKGIITSKDIIRALVTMDKEPSEIFAKEVMTSPIVSVNSNESVDQARVLMLERGIRKLPVQKGVDIIGLLVETDLIRDLSWYREKRF